MDSRLLTRIKLRYFKSIAACDVAPGPLAFLVGPNGSGKSNFLDSLRFVSDSLRHSLDHALRERGGINEVRMRSGGHPTHLGIRLEFNLTEHCSGYYAFQVGAEGGGAYSVKDEECFVTGPDMALAYFRVKDGVVEKSTVLAPPAAARDRLYLVNASGIPAFRPVYDALQDMGVYNLNPEAIRDLQPPDPGDLLSRDGGNIASVIAKLDARAPHVKARIEEYLSQVVSGVSSVDRVSVGTKETLQFRQEVRGAKQLWKFGAANMSDGTLRALGVLVALFQRAGNGRDSHLLVGIEEPEIALHPAAAGVLTDALQEASEFSQVLVTSHSTDLLDDDSIPDSAMLAVVAEHGETHIGVLDDAGRSVLRDRLYTPGELLRMDQLRPDLDATKVDPRQLNLLGPTPETT